MTMPSGMQSAAKPRQDPINCSKMSVDLTAHFLKTNGAGPKTPEGKAKSAQNARVHGLTAKTLRIADADRAEFDAIEAAWRNEIKPMDTIQEHVFNQLILAAWKLHIMPRVEEEELAKPGADRLKTLDRLSLYRSRIERSFSRTLAELRTLQENFLLKKAMVPQSPDYPSLVNVGRIRKEMQAYFKGRPAENPANKRTGERGRRQGHDPANRGRNPPHGGHRPAHRGRNPPLIPKNPPFMRGLAGIAQTEPRICQRSWAACVIMNVPVLPRLFQHSPEPAGQPRPPVLYVPS
jgi:hypothetical protein